MIDLWYSQAHVNKKQGRLTSLTTSNQINLEEINVSGKILIKRYKINWSTRKKSIHEVKIIYFIKREM